MLKVIAEDSDPIAPRSNTTMVYITIVDQNDNQPNFMNSRVTIHVMENVPLGFSVANVSDGGGVDEMVMMMMVILVVMLVVMMKMMIVMMMAMVMMRMLMMKMMVMMMMVILVVMLVGDDDNYSMVMLVIMVYVSNTDSIPLDHSRGPG